MSNFCQYVIERTSYLVARGRCWLDEKVYRTALASNMAKKSPAVVVQLSRKLKNVDLSEVQPIVWSLQLSWSLKINWESVCDTFNKFWTIPNGLNTKKWSASRSWQKRTSKPDAILLINICNVTINGAKSFFPTRKSPTLMVRMVLLIIGTIWEPKKKISANANLVVAPWWFGLQLVIKKKGDLTFVEGRMNAFAYHTRGLFRSTLEFFEIQNSAIIVSLHFSKKCNKMWN